LKAIGIGKCLSQRVVSGALRGGAYLGGCADPRSDTLDEIY
jgi:hypothetical protein